MHDRLPSGRAVIPTDVEAFDAGITRQRVLARMLNLIQQRSAFVRACVAPTSHVSTRDNEQMTECDWIKVAENKRS